ncbi:DUF3048 domain-containing protein [Streptacidiphilus rugosus]|uniref:DUF3048 domain-containing protein n=1 Tax=Streptacidiphilus rugosus TaxID=405783 RepID=UPI0018DC0CD8|nr:DUF3048 domain-containing protein [Streptacidiphilus rugosus]
MRELLEKIRTRWQASTKRTKAIVTAVALALVGTSVAVPLALANSSGTLPAAASPGSPSAMPKPAQRAMTLPVRTAPASSGDSPLTGLPGGAGRVLAVKIDNVGPAQYEQSGLNSADIVYAIQVEGGLSRYLAIFDSKHVPSRLGPVRSARQTDIPLLAAYGRVGLAYSGAISGLLPDLARANLQNITPQSGLFSHGGTMPTYISPSSVFAAYPNLAPAKNVGFTFGAQPSGGTPVTGFSEYMPAAGFAFTASGNSWLVSVDGHAAETLDQGRFSTTNVIVQHVSVLPGEFTDYNAAQPANEVFSQTTGHGGADFYRDAKVWHGQWTKGTDGSPTQYTVGGRAMPLAPGRTWVVLVP